MSEITTIAEFPLRGTPALKLIREIASNHTERIKLHPHAKNERMIQRNISYKQILSALSSRSNWISEGPYQDIKGDWACNVRGIGAGDSIEVVIKLKRLESNPSILVITVYKVN